MTKWVNPDVENNTMEITVWYTKKTGQAGDAIRFIEMIGAKTDAYGDRILIGGGHKKIPAADASGKVVWKITKDDIPNMKQGSIGGCFSCHDEQNMPALDEWPDGDDFDDVTEQEFKDWLKDIEEHGYEQYIDIAENNDTSFKTRCFQTADVADDEASSSFRFGHYNRGPAGWYYLELDPSTVLPPGWVLSTTPILGQPYFLNAEELLYGYVRITPTVPVIEGDEAVVTICTIDQDTLECPETFHLRAVTDTTPPVVLVSPSAVLDGNEVLVSMTAQDLPGTVASSKLHWELNNGPRQSSFMDIVTPTPDPVSFEERIGPLAPGLNQLRFYAVVRDELGNETVTPQQVVNFENSAGDAFCLGDGTGGPCPCANFGLPGTGCLHSQGGGAALSGSGNASAGADTLALNVTSAPSSVPGLFFSGSTQPGGGLGVPFGDGLLCAGGNIVRLQVVISGVSGNASSSIGISAKDGSTAGTTRFYQYWFRNVGGPCNSGFNTSGGLAVTWGA